jgi:tetratricopeptide (TPR) repeat protein
MRTSASQWDVVETRRDSPGQRIAEQLCQEQSSHACRTAKFIAQTKFMKRKFVLKGSVGVLALVGVWALVPIAQNLAASYLDKWIEQHAWLSACALLLSVLAMLYVWCSHKQAALRSEFGLLVECEKLKPEDLAFEVVAPKTEPANLSMRPYVSGVYIRRVAIAYEDRFQKAPRTYDERELQTILEEGYGFVLIGQPTDGKSRTLFEIATRLHGFVVVRPKYPLPSDRAMEVLRDRDVLCMFDDIDASIGQGIDLLEFYQRVAKVARLRPVAAACRDGDEFGEVLPKHGPLQRLYESLRHHFLLQRASLDEERALKKALGESEDMEAFSLGDISMRRAFDIMAVRFSALDSEAREIFWSIQLLAWSGVRELTHQHIRAVLHRLFAWEITLPGIRNGLGRLHDRSFILSAGEADPVIPADAFVSGPRAGSMYRPTRRYEDDLPDLICALREVKDARAFGSIALKRYVADDDGWGAATLWAESSSGFKVVDEQTEFERSSRYAEGLAMAVMTQGYHLFEQGRAAQAAERYREVVRKFSEASAPRVRALVARALADLGKSLEGQEKPDFAEAIKCYRESDRRFGQDATPSVRKEVATALVNLGAALNHENEAYDSLLAYEEVVRRYARRQWRFTTPACALPPCHRSTTQSCGLEDSMHWSMKTTPKFRANLLCSRWCV